MESWDIIFDNVPDSHQAIPEELSRTRGQPQKKRELSSLIFENPGRGARSRRPRRCEGEAAILSVVPVLQESGWRLLCYDGNGKHDGFQGNTIWQRRGREQWLAYSPRFRGKDTPFREPQPQAGRTGKDFPFYGRTVFSCGIICKKRAGSGQPWQNGGAVCPWKKIS